ncbi:MAG: hypothetical protein IJX89_05280 [Alphaproteobacteria bacterium]|nr:hypothetical protein [Alphaproteobacteria bacterium]
MEQTHNSLPLKNVPTATGKYRLYFIDATGKANPVDGTGLSLRPFELVAEFLDRKFVAVKKYTNHKPVLFLVSLRDGTIPATMPHGTFDIIFDTKNAALFFAPLYSNGKPTIEYSWCLPKANTPYQAINVPSILHPDIQSVHATTAVALPENIDVIEIKTHRKKRKTKPKTAIIGPKRPRGRPRGSKNRPKVITPIVPQKINQAKQNRVSLRRTTKNILNPTYDIYINGRRVAKQRMNASAKTFLNKRILVVSYQIPASLATNHDVFLPNGIQWQTNQRNRYTNAPATINGVTENNGSLLLSLSNNNRATIRESDLSHIPQQYFVIETQNQR